MYTPKHLRDENLNMSRAFEFVADGSRDSVCAASVFADSEKDGHKLFWDLLDPWQQNHTASIEMVWNYRTDGVHSFCR